MNLRYGIVKALPTLRGGLPLVGFVSAVEVVADVIGKELDQHARDSNIVPLSSTSYINTRDIGTRVRSRTVAVLSALLRNALAAASVGYAI